MATAVHPIHIVCVDEASRPLAKVEFDMAKLVTAYREQNPDPGPVPPLRCIVCGGIEPNGICVECDEGPRTT